MILWYKRIYYAARDDSTMGYLAFFVFFAVNIGWSIWCAIGEWAGKGVAAAGWLGGGRPHGSTHGTGRMGRGRAGL